MPTAAEPRVLSKSPPPLPTATPPAAPAPDKPAAAAVLPPAAAPVPERPPSPLGKLLTAVVVLALAGGGFYFWQKPGKQELACNALMSEASMKLAAGNMVGARSQAADLASRCEGPVKAQATEMLAALDRQQQASQADCDRKLRQLDNQVADRRILSARNGLDQLDGACADSVAASDLRQKVVATQATTSALEAKVRLDIGEGRLKEAKAGADQLAQLNREHPDLASLNSAIAAAVVASQQVVAPTPPAAVAAPAPVIQVPPAAAANHGELASTFLRDAEQALAQRRFDAAKTFVDSARRIDPNSAQAALLLRRIKDQELQYLREETSIK